MAVVTQPRDAVAPAGSVHPESAAPTEAGRQEAPWRSDLAIEARGAGKRYGDTWVVRNLSFEVEPGTIFGLFGPSGSGKTTTLRLLLGLVGLDEGEIRVLGTRPRGFRARTRAKIGYMPQLFVLYPEMSVLENVNLVASLYGMGWLRRRRPIRAILEFVELWEHRNKVAGDLSGGMKRRLELATALIHNPELIIVDEPTAGVDPVLRQKFWARFRELQKEGRTLVVTSQYVTEAEYCDHIAVLSEGETVAMGTPEQVRRQAMGGEIVDVVADGLERQHAQRLAGLPAVRRVRIIDYDHLQLTVEEAAPEIPRIVSTLQDSGVQVQQVQEYRPNFDEVFVKLVENSDASLHAAAG